MPKLRLPFAGRFLNQREIRNIHNFIEKTVQSRLAQERQKIPSTEELTRYGETWQQKISVALLGEYRPDSISIETYERMRWDAQIQLGLAMVKLPIISRDFEVECEDKDIATFVRIVFNRFWQALLKSTLTALDFGFAPHEKVWEFKEKMRIIDSAQNVDYVIDAFVYKKFKDLHPATITIRYDKNQDFNGFYQRIGGMEKITVEAEKAWVFTNNKEFGNITGYSRLKAAYPFWYTYWVIDAWHERWCQSRGKPPVIVKYPPGRSVTGVASDGQTPEFTDNAIIARQAGQNARPDSVITLPSTIKDEPGWDISEMQVQFGSGDHFLRYKDALDRAKLRAILVPERTVTQDMGTGSYKMAEMHTWLLLHQLGGLIDDIELHLNKYAVPQLVHYNFGDEAPDAYIRIEKIGKELERFLYEVYLQLLKTGQALPAVDVIEERLNIPRRKESGEIETPPEKKKQTKPKATEIEEEIPTASEKRAGAELVRSLIDFRDTIRHIINRRIEESELR